MIKRERKNTFDCSNKPVKNKARFGLCLILVFSLVLILVTSIVTFNINHDDTNDNDSNLEFVETPIDEALKAFDIVADPSTPGEAIFKGLKPSQQFLEKINDLNTLRIPETVEIEGAQLMVTKIDIELDKSAITKNSNRVEDIYGTGTLYYPMPTDGFKKTSAYLSSNIQKLVIPKTIKEVTPASLFGFASLKYLETPFVGTRRISNLEERHIVRHDSTIATNYDGLLTTMFGHNQSFGEDSFLGFVSYGVDGNTPDPTSISPQTMARLGTTYYLYPAHLESVLITGEDFYKIRPDTGEIDTDSKQEMDVIVDDALHGISSLKEVTVGDITVNDSKRGLLEHLPIPNMRGIGDNAFSNCENLQKVTLNISGVSHLYKYLFVGDEKLTDVVLPKGLDEIPVGCFSGCTTLANVNNIGGNGLPNIISVGDGAFFRCEALPATFVDNLPKTLERIGNAAFKGCTSITSVNFRHLNNLVSIGRGAFYGCFEIKEMVLPFIGENADSKFVDFNSDLTLEEIEHDKNSFNWIFASNHPNDVDSTFDDFIHSGVTEKTKFYKSYQVYHVSNGKKTSIEAYLPKSLTKLTILKETAFAEGCLQELNSLRELTFETYDAKIFTDGMLYGCNSLEILSIPTIGYNYGSGSPSNLTFGHLFGLQKNHIKLPRNLSDGVTNQKLVTESVSPDICDSMPVSLKKLTITNQPTIYRKNLWDLPIETLVIEKATTRILEEALTNCGHLISLTVPFVGEQSGTDSATYYDPKYGYSWVSVQNFDWDSMSWLFAIDRQQSVIKNKELYYVNEAFHKYYSYSGDLSDYNTWLACGWHYIPKSLKEIHITGEETVISSYAFKGLNLVENIIIDPLNKDTHPNDDMIIGAGTFEGCSNLINLNIPFVGYNAHPSNYDSQNYNYTLGYMFGSKKYENAYKAKMYYLRNDNTIESMDAGAESYIPLSLKNITISGAFNIPNSAFMNATSLESIVFSGSSQIVGIGSHAFYNCSNLDKYVISFTHKDTGYYQPKEIGKYAFYNCLGITDINTVITDDTRTLGAYSFAKTSIYRATNELDLNNLRNVKYIYDGAFAGCNEIYRVIIPAHGDLEKIHKLGNNLFEDCIYLSDVKLLAPNVTTNYMFKNCRNIVSLDLTQEDEIKTGLLYGCTGINSIIVYTEDRIENDKIGRVAINKDLEKIGSEAFYGCKNITKFTIPENVTTIGTRAFGECLGLENIVIPFKTTNLGTDIFKDCNDIFAIYVYHIEEKWPTTWETNWNSGFPVFVIGNQGEEMFTYELSKDGTKTWVITGVNPEYKDISGILEIPTHHHGLPVVAIKSLKCGDKALENINTIHLPANIKSIGREAFYGMNMVVDKETQIKKEETLIIYSDLYENELIHSTVMGGVAEKTYSDNGSSPKNTDFTTNALIFYRDKWQYDSKRKTYQLDISKFNFEVEKDEFNFTGQQQTLNFTSITTTAKAVGVAGQLEYPKGMFTYKYSSNIDKTTSASVLIKTNDTRFYSSKTIYFTILGRKLTFKVGNPYQFKHTTHYLSTMKYNGEPWKYDQITQDNFIENEILSKSHSFSGVLTTKSSDAGEYWGALGELVWKQPFKIYYNGRNVTNNYEVDFSLVDVTIESIEIEVGWEVNGEIYKAANGEATIPYTSQKITPIPVVLEPGTKDINEHLTYVIFGESRTKSPQAKAKYKIGIETIYKTAEEVKDSDCDYDPTGEKKLEAKATKVSEGNSNFEFAAPGGIPTNILKYAVGKGKIEISIKEDHYKIKTDEDRFEAALANSPYVKGLGVHDKIEGLLITNSDAKGKYTFNNGRTEKFIDIDSFNPIKITNRDGNDITDYYDCKINEDSYVVIEYNDFKYEFEIVEHNTDPLVVEKPDNIIYGADGGIKKITYRTDGKYHALRVKILNEDIKNKTVVTYHYEEGDNRNYIEGNKDAGTESLRFYQDVRSYLIQINLEARHYNPILINQFELEFLKNNVHINEVFEKTYDGKPFDYLPNILKIGEDQLARMKVEFTRNTGEVLKAAPTYAGDYFIQFTLDTLVESPYFYNVFESTGTNILKSPLKINPKKVYIDALEEKQWKYYEKSVPWQLDISNLVNQEDLIFGDIFQGGSFKTNHYIPGVYNRDKDIIASFVVENANLDNISTSYTFLPNFDPIIKSKTLKPGTDEGDSGKDFYITTFKGEYDGLAHQLEVKFYDEEFGKNFVVYYTSTYSEKNEPYENRSGYSPLAYISSTLKPRVINYKITSKDPYEYEEVESSGELWIYPLTIKYSLEGGTDSQREIFKGLEEPDSLLYNYIISDDYNYGVEYFVKVKETGSTGNYNPRMQISYCWGGLYSENKVSNPDWKNMPAFQKYPLRINEPGEYLVWIKITAPEHYDLIKPIKMTYNSPSMPPVYVSQTLVYFDVQNPNKEYRVSIQIPDQAGATIYYSRTLPRFVNAAYGNNTKTISDVPVVIAPGIKTTAFQKSYGALDVTSWSTDEPVFKEISDNDIYMKIVWPGFKPVYVYTRICIHDITNTFPPGSDTGKETMEGVVFESTEFDFDHQKHSASYTIPQDILNNYGNLIQVFSSENPDALYNPSSSLWRSGLVGFDDPGVHSMYIMIRLINYKPVYSEELTVTINTLAIKEIGFENYEGIYDGQYHTIKPTTGFTYTSSAGGYYYYGGDPQNRVEFYSTENKAAVGNQTSASWEQGLKMYKFYKETGDHINHLYVMVIVRGYAPAYYGDGEDCHVIINKRNCDVDILTDKIEYLNRPINENDLNIVSDYHTSNPVYKYYKANPETQQKVGNPLPTGPQELGHYYVEIDWPDDTNCFAAHAAKYFEIVRRQITFDNVIKNIFKVEYTGNIQTPTELNLGLNTHTDEVLDVIIDADIASSDPMAHYLDRDSDLYYDRPIEIGDYIFKIRLTEFNKNYYLVNPDSTADDFKESDIIEIVYQITPISIDIKFNTKVEKSNEAPKFTYEELVNSGVISLEEDTIVNSKIVRKRMVVGQDDYLEEELLYPHIGGFVKTNSGVTGIYKYYKDTPSSATNTVTADFKVVDITDDPFDYYIFNYDITIEIVRPQLKAEVLDYEMPYDSAYHEPEITGLESYSSAHPQFFEDPGMNVIAKKRRFKDVIDKTYYYRITAYMPGLENEDDIRECHGDVRIHITKANLEIVLNSKTKVYDGLPFDLDFTIANFDSSLGNQENYLADKSLGKVYYFRYDEWNEKTISQIFDDPTLANPYYRNFINNEADFISAVDAGKYYTVVYFEDSKNWNSSYHIDEVEIEKRDLHVQFKPGFTFIESYPYQKDQRRGFNVYNKIDIRVEDLINDQINGIVHKYTPSIFDSVVTKSANCGIYSKADDFEFSSINIYDVMEPSINVGLNYKPILSGGNISIEITQIPLPPIIVVEEQSKPYTGKFVEPDIIKPEDGSGDPIYKTIYAYDENDLVDRSKNLVPQGCINVGKYEITFTIGAGLNYLASDKEYKCILTITPAILEVVWDEASLTRVYDGKLVPPKATFVDFDNEIHELSMRFDGEYFGTTAGEWKVTAYIPDGISIYKNYEFSNAVNTFVVEKYNWTIKITDEKPYDGEPWSAKYNYNDNRWSGANETTDLGEMLPDHDIAFDIRTEDGLPKNYMLGHDIRNKNVPGFDEPAFGSGIDFISSLSMYTKIQSTLEPNNFSKSRSTDVFDSFNIIIEGDVKITGGSIDLVYEDDITYSYSGTYYYIDAKQNKVINVKFPKNYEIKYEYYKEVEGIEHAIVTGDPVKLKDVGVYIVNFTLTYKTQVEYGSIRVNIIKAKPTFVINTDLDRDYKPGEKPFTQTMWNEIKLGGWGGSFNGYQNEHDWDSLVWELFYLGDDQTGSGIKLDSNCEVNGELIDDAGYYLIQVRSKADSDPDFINKNYETLMYPKIFKIRTKVVEIELDTKELILTEKALPQPNPNPNLAKFGEAWVKNGEVTFKVQGTNGVKESDYKISYSFKINNIIDNKYIMNTNFRNVGENKLYDTARKEYGLFTWNVLVKEGLDYVPEYKDVNNFSVQLITNIDAHRKRMNITVNNININWEPGLHYNPDVKISPETANALAEAGSVAKIEYSKYKGQSAVYGNFDMPTAPVHENEKYIRYVRVTAFDFETYYATFTIQINRIKRDNLSLVLPNSGTLKYNDQEVNLAEFDVLDTKRFGEDYYDLLPEMFTFTNPDYDPALGLPKNAGEYNVTINIPETPHYEATSVSGILTITKRKVVIHIDNVEMGYNEHKWEFEFPDSTNPSVYYDSLCPNHILTGTLSTSMADRGVYKYIARPQAGEEKYLYWKIPINVDNTKTVTKETDLKDNYIFEFDLDHQVEITAGLMQVSHKNYDDVFDGDVHKVEFMVKQPSDLSILDCKILYSATEDGIYSEDNSVLNSATNAGLYTFFYKVESKSGNYITTAPQKATINIRKAKADFELPIDLNKQYDSRAVNYPKLAFGNKYLENTEDIEQLTLYQFRKAILEADGNYSVGDKLAEGHLGEESRGRPKNCGHYYLTVITPATTNYEGMRKDFLFEIKPRPIIISWKNLEHEYDGTPKVPTFTLANNGDPIEYAENEIHLFDKELADLTQIKEFVIKRIVGEKETPVTQAIDAGEYQFSVKLIKELDNFTFKYPDSITGEEIDTNKAKLTIAHRQLTVTLTTTVVHKGSAFEFTNGNGLNGTYKVTGLPEQNNHEFSGTLITTDSKIGSLTYDGLVKEHQNKLNESFSWKEMFKLERILVADGSETPVKVDAKHNFYIKYNLKVEVVSKDVKYDVLSDNHVYDGNEHFFKVIPSESLKNVRVGYSVEGDPNYQDQDGNRIYKYLKDGVSFVHVNFDQEKADLPYIIHFIIELYIKGETAETTVQETIAMGSGELTISRANPNIKGFEFLPRYQYTGNCVQMPVVTYDGMNEHKRDTVLKIWYSRNGGVIETINDPTFYDIKKVTEVGSYKVEYGVSGKYYEGGSLKYWDYLGDYTKEEGNKVLEADGVYKSDEFQITKRTITINIGEHVKEYNKAIPYKMTIDSTDTSGKDFTINPKDLLDIHGLHGELTTPSASAGYYENNDLIWLPYPETKFKNLIYLKSDESVDASFNYNVQIVGSVRITPTIVDVIPSNAENKVVDGASHYIIKKPYIKDHTYFIEFKYKSPSTNPEDYIVKYGYSANSINSETPLGVKRGNRDIWYSVEFIGEGKENYKKTFNSVTFNIYDEDELGDKLKDLLDRDYNGLPYEVGLNNLPIQSTGVMTVKYFIFDPQANPNKPLGDLLNYPDANMLPGAPVDANSYHVIVIVDSTAEYGKLTFDGDFTIRPKEVEAIWSKDGLEGTVTRGANIQFVYNGELQCPVAHYMDVFNQKQPLVVTGEKMAVSSDYEAVATLDDPNYKLVNETCLFDIIKLSLDDVEPLPGTDGKLLRLPDFKNPVIPYVDPKRPDGKLFILIDQLTQNKYIFDESNILIEIRTENNDLLIGQENIGKLPFEIEIVDFTFDRLPGKYNYEVKPRPVSTYDIVNPVKGVIEIVPRKLTKAEVTVYLINPETKAEGETAFEYKGLEINPGVVIRFIVDGTPLNPDNYVVSYAGERNKITPEEITDPETEQPRVIITSNDPSIPNPKYDIDFVVNFTIFSKIKTIMLKDDSTLKFVEITQTKTKTYYDYTIDNKTRNARVEDGTAQNIYLGHFYVGVTEVDKEAGIFIDYTKYTIRRYIDENIANNSKFIRVLTGEGEELSKYQTIEESEWDKKTLGTNMIIQLMDNQLENPLDSIRCVVYGDCNGDGAVTGLDLTLVSDSITGKTTILSDYKDTIDAAYYYAGCFGDRFATSNNDRPNGFVVTCISKIISDQNFKDEINIYYDDLFKNHMKEGA